MNEYIIKTRLLTIEHILQSRIGSDESNSQFPFLDHENTKFLECIIKSFHRIWKLSRTHPKLKDNFSDQNLMENIFKDMISDVACSGDAPSLTFICEECNSEILLLNDDMEYSYQMHLQSPEHEKIVNNLKTQNRVHPVATSNRSSSSSVPALNKWIVGSGENRRCILCDVKLPHDSQFQSHTATVYHKNNVKQAERSIISTDTTVFQSDKWIVGSGENRRCILCDAKLPHDSQFQSHTAAVYHKNNVKQAETSTIRTSNNSTDTTVFPSDKWIVGTGINRRCIPCCAKLCSDYDLQSHTASARHKKNVDKLKLLYSTIRASKSSNATTDFASNKNGSYIVGSGVNRRCILCDAKLCGDSNFQAHIASLRHRRSIILFEDQMVTKTHLICGCLSKDNPENFYMHKVSDNYKEALQVESTA